MLFSNVTLENIKTAVNHFNAKGTPEGFSTSKYYDVKIDGVLYPPKPIMAIANYYATDRKVENYFPGGLNTPCFKAYQRLGIEIVSKSNQLLDESLFQNHFEEYLAYCKRSQWLKYREAYKFKFGRWLSSRIDFDEMEDEAILKVCIDSQEQYYDEEGKGINFIKSALQFQDEFITLHDIQLLRKLSNGGLLERNDLQDSPLSFPKLSVWAGILIPDQYKIYANDELIVGIAHLFNLEKYPKTGLKAFNLANDSLNILATEIASKYNSDLQSLVALIFEDDAALKPSDLAWFTQDFILYLNRRVLDKKIDYYWINQGSTYNEELTHNCIAATNGSIHHHKRLKEMMEGDVLINYANSAIRAISTVTDEFEIKPRPYDLDGEKSLVVGVKYSELENPINASDIKLIFENAIDILPKKYGPFDKHLSVVQSYCLAFNEESYQLLFNPAKRNYWVFQGTPKVFDFETALRQEILTDWTVSAHKDKIKKGDKVILWIVGNKSGCYALAEIVSEPHKRTYSPDDHLWKETDNSEFKADIKITHNLVDTPILKEQVVSFEALKNIKAGNQGTNFSATASEYNCILEIVKNKKIEKSNSMDSPDIFQIIVSKKHKDESGNFLTAKMQLVEKGYLLLKGSYIYKEPKPSFLIHSYYKMRMEYETDEYMEDSNYEDYFILKKSITFSAPSPAAVIVLNRAANGKNEWKLADGTTLEEFENKFDFSKIINQFLEQAKTNNLKTKQYPKRYGALKVKVSFGAGNQAEIPWIALLKEPNKVTEGIYPVYLYFKKEHKLILAYGLSETNNPTTIWNIEDPTTITNYFYKNGLGKPKRYGNSFVYKVYDVPNLPDETILNDDLDAILSNYKQQEETISIEIETEDVVEPEDLIEQEDFELSKFIIDTKASGLLFTDTLLTRFVSSLITKPFVLLSGLSGSGKTKLAQTFAKWVCETDKQYCVVPVGADWTNREPLLGYENALNNKEYILPENGALQLVINANQNASKPHFLILDEMNLSHVERYFSDFLSVMESKEKFKLHSEQGTVKSTVPSELSWPKNLFVIGTVNIDETTYMFSPKVLDRANVIEFRVQEDEIESFLKTPKDIDFTNLIGNGSTMAVDFINMASNGTNGTTSQELNETLVKFFTQLKKTGAEFGYRTAMEIHRLFHQLEVVNSKLTTNQKIDIAIMQKLLPKLHGSRRKLCPVLENLGGLCVQEMDAKKEFFENNDDLNFEMDNIRYPLSLEKITRMYKGAIDNGFASYAEA